MKSNKYLKIIFNCIIFTVFFITINNNLVYSNEGNEYPNILEPDITDVSTWHIGRYLNNGKYSSWPSYYCQKNLRLISPEKAYKIKISDDNFRVNIVLMDNNKNPIDELEYGDGGEFKTPSNTYYAAISLYNYNNYRLYDLGYKEAFKNGLNITFEEINNYSSYIEARNLSDFGAWEQGLYDTETLQKKSVWDYIRISKFVDCEPNTIYKYTSSDEKMKLTIIQLDNNNNILETKSYLNGDEIYTNINATRMAISLKATNSQSYNTLKKSFQGLKLKIDKISHRDTEIENFPVTLSVSNEECFYKIPENIKTLKLSMSNNIRVILKEYDKNKNYTYTTDLSNFEYIYLKESTSYITLSAYKFENSMESELEQPEKISLDSIDDETLSNIITAEPELVGELKGDSIINYANYRTGWYKSWGGNYELKDNMECSRNKYLVNPDFTYYFNTNDSRFCISIQQYDENGNWIKFYGELKNGDIYKPTNNKVKYITIRAYTSVWGVGIQQLMKNGLWVNFGIENKEFKTDFINENEFEFTNVNSWRTGEYAYSTGKYALNEKSVCSTKYIYLNNNETRRIRTLEPSVKLYILEFDKDGIMTHSEEFTNGSTWTPKDDTVYIAITLNNTSSLNSDEMLEKIRNEEIKPSLDIRIKYNYNTQMKDITADELVENINVGWNLGNSFDSYYGDWGTEHQKLETIWGNPTVSQELIDFVADQGFNSIRIPVSWYLNTYIDENGNYKVYDYWIDRVQDVVDYAIQRNMYVIINTHFDSHYLTMGLEEEQMENEYKYAKDLWTDIATYFKDYDEHLVFESYNELATKTQAWTYTEIGNEQMAKLNQIFVDAVRSTGGNNVNRVLCVQTLTSMYDAQTLDNFKLPKDIVDNKIIVQVHNYSECVDQSIEPFFSNLETFSNRINAPVIIGEYAVNNGAEKIQYKPYKISNYVARAARYGIKVFYWDDGNSKHYYLVNRRDIENSDIESINALINAKAYSTDEVQFLTSYDNFVYMTMNQSTGEFKEDKYWGTIVTKDVDGHAIEIPENSELVTLTLGTNSVTDTYKIHYVAFFDNNMNLVEIKNSNVGYRNEIFNIPEKAKYIRIGINSSYCATGDTVYAKYFACQELGLSISFENKELLFEDIDNIGKVLKIEPNNGGNFFEDFESIDFNKFDSWVMGSYPWGKMLDTNSTSSMAIDKFLRIENGKVLNYKSSSNAVRLTISEYNSNMKILNSKTLCNGQNLTLSNDTSYISVQISAPYQSVEWTEETFKNWFLNGSDISFE